MTAPDIDSLTSRIRTALCCGRDLARDYATAIGNNPEIQGGQIIVRNEEGRVIARIPESVLQEEA